MFDSLLLRVYFRSHGGQGYECVVTEYGYGVTGIEGGVCLEAWITMLDKAVFSNMSIMTVVYEAGIRVFHS